MTTIYINVDVYDKEQLYAAALKRALEDELTEDEVNEMLKPAGEIDTSACLIMVFDPGLSPPGVSINDSSVGP